MATPIRQRIANNLRKGYQVMNHGNHHWGMSLLKEQLGNPRPEGKELSLINPDSPHAYWGFRSSNKDQPYRLSTNPDDYAWETPSQNAMRKSKGTRERTAKNASSHVVPKTTKEWRKGRSNKSLCQRWNINRDKPCSCGQHDRTAS